MNKFDYIQKIEYKNKVGQSCWIYVRKIDKENNKVVIVTFIEGLLHANVECEIYVNPVYRGDYFMFDGQEFPL
jgi:hypothetical protein